MAIAVKILLYFNKKKDIFLIFLILFFQSVDKLYNLLGVR